MEKVEYPIHQKLLENILFLKVSDTILKGVYNMSCLKILFFMHLQ